MNNSITAATAPREVDIGHVEKELSSLWQSSGDPGTHTAMRASSCNLLVFARNRTVAEEFPDILARIAEWHPCRSIVAYVEPDARLEAPDMHAWIRVLCQLPPSGGSRVCCETILLATRNRAKPDLPDTVSTLLIPDLPVYLYWRSFRAEDQDIIERLARFSRLMIVDSHQTRENPQARLEVLQLLVDCPAEVEMRDLNWSRITAWRDLIAQFFDSTATGHYVREISEVEITRNLSAPDSIPTRTLLLTGWLASSLGWRRVTAKRSGNQWISIWNCQGREVRVTFTGTVADEGQIPGIHSVILRTGSQAEFSVSVERSSQSITAVATIGGTRIIHSVPDEPLDEASLLIRELSTSGKDEAFTAALAEACDLEKAFRDSNPKD